MRKNPMWKISLSLFFALSLIIGGVLFWQWSTYSDKKADTKNIELEKVEQEITVEAQKRELKITQKISGLSSNKEYRILAPDRIKKWKCMINDKKACNSKDENPNTFLAKNGEMLLQINISMKRYGNSSFLLSDWFVTIPNTKVENSTVKIIDYAKRKGSWVTGLPLKGSKNLDYISYYQYKGANDPGSLYWQPKPLKKKDYPVGITVFYEGKKSPDFHFDSLKNIAKFPYVSVVVSSNYNESNGEGVIVINRTTQLKLLEKRLAYSFYLTKFDQLPLEENWLLDTLASLSVNQKSKTEKGNRMIKEIRENLTSEEIKNFLKAIQREEALLTTVKMDELLSQMLGKDTHFFTLNKNEATKFIPLYLYDQRKVLVNDEIKKDVHLIYQDKTKLFPFEITMKELGYQVKMMPDKQSILLSKGNNNYRLYLNDYIFVYNQGTYGLLEKPLKILNGTVYVEQKWLQSIFKIGVTESNEEIRLTTIE